jgi:SAM-dependent methyltransferase
MAGSTKSKVNLACGSAFVAGDGWTNLDYAAANEHVLRANLLGRLPLPDDGAALVYCSHFLEHIPRSQVVGFLAECFRVLAPGGTLRLVLPDLENLCRAYLEHRERGEHDKADFVVLEMVDQCVRRTSGGELGRFYGQLRSDPATYAEMMAFVRDRTGEDLSTAPPTRRLGSLGGGLALGVRQVAGKATALVDTQRLAAFTHGIPRTKRQPRRCRRTASLAMGLPSGARASGRSRIPKRRAPSGMQ